MGNPSEKDNKKRKANALSKQENEVHGKKTLAVFPSADELEISHHAASPTETQQRKRKMAVDTIAKCGEAGDNEKKSATAAAKRGKSGDTQEMSASRRAGIKHRAKRKEIEEDLRQKLAECYVDSARIRKENEKIREENASISETNEHLLSLSRQLGGEDLIDQTRNRTGTG